DLGSAPIRMAVRHGPDPRRVIEPLPPPPPSPPVPPGWGAGEAVGGALAAIFAGFLVGGVVFLVTEGLSCGAQTVLASVTSELAFGGAVLLWVRYVAKAPFAALGLPREPLRDVRVGVVGGIVVIVVGWVALLLLG